jgi:hypothetical protein
LTENHKTLVSEVQENEFFNDFVEMKNIAQGDRNEFWVDKDVILTVAHVSGDHHDLNNSRVCVVRAA